MNKIEIRISDVSKSFGATPALRNASIVFRDGGLYGVIGPAGAGKTTLFRILLRLMRENSGAVRYMVDGNEADFETLREHIAYMPQSQSLYADLSVAEHLDFFRRLYGIDNAEFARRRASLVHLARLDRFLDRPAGKLSGGMYKKLGLICALLRSPKIMLLDEPTNGVDPISRREFWSLLNTSREQGILVITSTAYMDEAERCSDVVLMERGRVLAVGEPASMLAQNKCASFDEFFIRRGGAEND